MLTTLYFVMHHACLCIMSCLCLCVYYVVCFFSVVLLLDSSCFVAIVRIRSSMPCSSSWLHVLHGLVLLPSGMSGKMTITLDLTTIIAMLVALFYCLPRYLSLVLQASQFAMSASNLFSPFLANRCLAMLLLLLSPSYSVVSCR